MALLIAETPVRIFLQTCKEARLLFAHTYFDVSPAGIGRLALPAPPRSRRRKWNNSKQLKLNENEKDSALDLWSLV